MLLVTIARKLNYNHTTPKYIYYISHVHIMQIARVYYVIMSLYNFSAAACLRRDVSFFPVEVSILYNLHQMQQTPVGVTYIVRLR